MPDSQYEIYRTQAQAALFPVALLNVQSSQHRIVSLIVYSGRFKIRTPLFRKVISLPR